MKTDSKARWQGYQFFFKEGFCWSDINTTYLKCRIKGKSVNDVKSMSLYNLSTVVTTEFFISLINSTLISFYVDCFVNNTQTFQINDARQIPVIIPDDNTQATIIKICQRAIDIQKQFFNKKITLKENQKLLNDIQVEIDKIIEFLYRI